MAISVVSCVESGEVGSGGGVAGQEGGKEDTGDEGGTDFGGVPRRMRGLVTRPKEVWSDEDCFLVEDRVRRGILRRLEIVGGQVR